MRYAILSDIHGNIRALDAALAHASAQNIQQYLFLGDYTSRLPWGNAVAEKIQSIPNAIVIKGNGEAYFAHPMDYSIHQNGLITYNAQALAPSNMAYLLSLPDIHTIPDPAATIYMQHSITLFFRAQKIPEFHTHLYDAPNHTQYLQQARKAILANKDAAAEIMALPPGIHLFGHNHLQFHMAYEGRIFINPGSCGNACDHDNTAAYTILDTTGGNIHIEEIRVPYNIPQTVEALEAHDFTTQHPFYAHLVKASTLTGKDHFGPFVMALKKAAIESGQASPVSNEFFAEFISTFV